MLVGMGVPFEPALHEHNTTTNATNVKENCRSIFYDSKTQPLCRINAGHQEKGKRSKEKRKRQSPHLKEEEEDELTLKFYIIVPLRSTIDTNYMADSAGSTLMDLISSDPTPTSAPPPSSSSTSAPPAALPPASSGMRRPVTTTDRKSKRGTLLQIQSDTVSAAKAALNPVRANILPQKQKQKQKKKPVSYAQLARSIHELAATSDQKSSQKQLVHHVFPKLAVYNSVDPSLAPSLLMLDQQCEDRTVLRYVYYYLARILGDTGSQGLTPGGGIPTPNWDALAGIDAVGGVT